MAQPRRKQQRRLAAECSGRGRLRVPIATPREEAALSGLDVMLAQRSETIEAGRAIGGDIGAGCQQFDAVA